MSQLGKTFLWIALAGAIVAIVFGVLLIGQYDGTKQDLGQTKQSLEDQKKATQKANQLADATAKAKADDDAQWSQAKEKVDDLTGKLTDAQKAQDGLKEALQTASDAAKKAQDDLQAIKDDLGMTPAEAKAKIKAAEDEVASTLSEKKIVEDALQKSQKDVEDLRDALAREGSGKQPPGISGKVTFVNRTWNFVVLDVGLSNGVVPNGELIIYRGNNFLGKVKVTSAEATTAVADILPDVKGNIQIGDHVLN